MSFYRVYENDQPLKTKNFYKWSVEGAKEGDAVFVIGNPGTTNRLLTVSQLEFNRDYRYAYTLEFIDNLVTIYSTFIENHPDKRQEYQTRLFGASNSQKAIGGYLGGHRDPVVMAKKKDFEKTFRTAVLAKPELATKYGTVWDEIATFQPTKAKIYYELNAYQWRGRSSAFGVAADLVDFAVQMGKPEAERDRRFKGPALEAFKQRLFPATIEADMEHDLLAYQLSVLKRDLGAINSNVAALLGGQEPKAAAERLLKESMVGNKENVLALLNGSPDAILASTDPMISFVAKSRDAADKVMAQWTEISGKEAAKVQLLGKALFEVYGVSIPPDANFNLRIADGVVKGYPYNGTIAPPTTTFYGMYDRHYSHKKSDWKLPAKWLNPPPSFDMSTPLNFVSTNDIIGGNSGSAVINVRHEVVGLIFDGNIESLPGNIIFDETLNRSVAVQSAGILEAVEDIYKAERLAKELRTSKAQ